MADAFGGTIALGTDYGLGGVARRSSGSEVTLALSDGQVVRVEASKALPIAKVADLRKLLHVEFDEFHHLDWERWSDDKAGAATAFVVNQSANTYLDAATGVLRLSPNTGTTSGDNVTLRRTNAANVGRIDTFAGQRWGFWAALNNPAGFKGSIGLGRTTSAGQGVRPSPSFAFVFDPAASANVRFQHHNGGASTSDTDTGVTLASLNLSSGGVWKHFYLLWDGSVMRAYIDGVQVATVSGSALPTGTNLYQGPRMYLEGNGTAQRSVFVDAFYQLAQRRFDVL